MDYQYFNQPTISQQFPIWKKGGCRDAIDRVLYRGHILFSIKIGIQFEQDAINRVSTKPFFPNEKLLTISLFELGMKEFKGIKYVKILF